MFKLARKIAPLAVVGYGVLQSPQGRAAVAKGLHLASGYLSALDGRHGDPAVSTLTGKPVATLNPKVAKLEAHANKLPQGSFQKAAAMASKAEAKLSALPVNGPRA